MVALKLTPEEKWLEVTFSTNVEKSFAKEVGKEADRKDLDKRIAAFHARWDDIRGLIKFVQDSKDLMDKRNTDKFADDAFNDLLKGLKDAQKEAKSGEIFKAHLALSAPLEDVEKHLLDKKHQYPMNSKSPLRP